MLHQHAGRNAMRITIDVTELVSTSPPVWKATLSPEQVRQLSTPLGSFGGASVILIDDPQYQSARHQLAFPFGSARVLNLGASADSLIVGVAAKAASPEPAPPGLGLSLGDKSFLHALRSSRVPEDLKEAGEKLILFARELDPAGDLQHKGQRHVSFPDNWVTFQIQPQVREILVTYKGNVPNRLKPTSSARRPYSGFKLRGSQDVEEAKRVLRGAIRRS
jgi:hypothetical protein